ncbi:MAG: hypothetical protein IKJ01_00310 [Lachnospiraceae bacterium]|nr:hypothetical protein [Lachnospiraceae bacterium]
MIVLLLLILLIWYYKKSTIIPKNIESNNQYVAKNKIKAVKNENKNKEETI